MDGGEAENAESIRSLANPAHALPKIEQAFRALVAYDGAAYSGWQFQPNARTVQGELERALHAVTGERVRIEGAGRTDQGVHALGQIASFRVVTNLAPERLRAAMSFHLPPDIRVHRLALAPEEFSARFSARWRLYWYLLAREASPFTFRRAHTPRQWPKLDPMNEALSFLLGEWSFRGFTTQPEGPFGCYVSEARWEETPLGLTLRIRANRFLYHMVRIVVGTSLDIGMGKRPPRTMADVLLSENRSMAGPLASGDGLYLAAVGYDPPWPEAELPIDLGPAPFAALVQPTWEPRERDRSFEARSRPSHES